MNNTAMEMLIGYTEAKDRVKTYSNIIDTLSMNNNYYLILFDLLEQYRNIVKIYEEREELKDLIELVNMI